MSYELRIINYQLSNKMDYNELKQKAEVERKSAHLNEALALYEQIVTLPEANEWDFYFFALIFYQLKKYAQSLDICRKLYVKNKNFVPLNNLYAQNIVYTVFYLPHLYDLEHLKQALVAVTKMLDSKNKFMTIEKAFYYLLKRLNTNQKWQMVIDFTNSTGIKPADFDTSEAQKQQKAVYPPIAETFYIERIKAFFELGNYEKVVAEVDESLQKINRFCYNNHIWIRRLKAQALLKLNEPKNALSVMFDVVNRKDEWFLNFEIAQIIHQTGEKKATEYFLLKALAGRQEAKYKPHLFLFILENSYLEFLTVLTAQVLASIYYAMNKELPQIVKDFVGQAEINQDSETKNNELTKKAQKLLNGMKHRAIVTRVLSPKNGFLRSEGKDFFYKNNSKLKLEIGNELECFEAWDWNQKKQELNKIMII